MVVEGILRLNIRQFGGRVCNNECTSLVVNPGCKWTWGDGRSRHQSLTHGLSEKQSEALMLEGTARSVTLPTVVGSLPGLPRICQFG